MLIKLAPQKVENDDLGYLVQVADRYHIEYIEKDKRAIIDVDFGPVVGIYRDSLVHWITPVGTCAMSEDEINIVLSRISEALQFMGNQTEFC